MKTGYFRGALSGWRADLFHSFRGGKENLNKHAAHGDSLMLIAIKEKLWPENEIERQQYVDSAFFQVLIK